MSLRYFLPFYLFVYLLTAFIWRSFVVWKRTGVNPVTFKGTGSAHDIKDESHGLIRGPLQHRRYEQHQHLKQLGSFTITALLSVYAPNHSTPSFTIRHWKL